MPRFVVSMITHVAGFAMLETEFAAEHPGIDALKTEPDTTPADARPTSLFNDLTGWHVHVPQLDTAPNANATFLVRFGEHFPINGVSSFYDPKDSLCP
jgi:hypothetical protein